MRFSVGDKVKIKEDCSGCKKGKVYPLHLGHTDGSYENELVAWDKTMIATEMCGCSCQDNWILVEKAGRPRKEKPREPIQDKEKVKVKKVEISKSYKLELEGQTIEIKTETGKKTVEVIGGITQNRYFSSKELLVLSKILKVASKLGGEND